MPTKNIPIDQLCWDSIRTFLIVARAGSLSRAARYLQIDHSTISRRIAQLESTLNMGVFIRQTGGMIPTEMGRRILEFAERMDSSMIMLREFLASDSDTPSGNVRIATMEGIGSMYLSKFAPELRKRYPSINLELVTSPYHVNLNRREADIFLSFFKPQGRNMQRRKIAEFFLDIYGSQSYFSKMGIPTCREDLHNHHFVTYVDDLIQLDAVRWLDDILVYRNTEFTSNSMIAQAVAAEMGVGLALLPRFSVSHFQDLIKVDLADLPVMRPLWISVHNDMKSIPRIRAVIDFIRSMIVKDTVNFAPVQIYRPVTALPTS